MARGIDRLRIVRRGLLCRDRHTWNFFITSKGNLIGETRYEGVSSHFFEDDVDPHVYDEIVRLLDRLTPQDSPDPSKVLAVVRTEDGKQVLYFLDDWCEYGSATPEQDLWAILRRVVVELEAHPKS